MADAFDHCEQLVRAADRIAFWRRFSRRRAAARALWALYAFNAEIARVRERIREPLPGEIRLQWWRDALDGAAPGATAIRWPPRCATPWCATACRRGTLAELIDARIFDLYDDPMPSLADLERYAARPPRRCSSLRAILLDGRDPDDRRARRPCRVAHAHRRTDPRAAAPSRARPVLYAGRCPGCARRRAADVLSPAGHRRAARGAGRVAAALAPPPSGRGSTAVGRGAAGGRCRRFLPLALVRPAARPHAAAGAGLHSRPTCRNGAGNGRCGARASAAAALIFEHLSLIPAAIRSRCGAARRQRDSRRARARVIARFLARPCPCRAAACRRRSWSAVRSGGNRPKLTFIGWKERGPASIGLDVSAGDVVEQRADGRGRRRRQDGSPRRSAAAKRPASRPIGGTST